MIQTATRQLVWTSVLVLLNATLLGSLAWAAPPAQNEPASSKSIGSDSVSTSVENVAHAKENADKQKWKSLSGHWQACEFGGDGPTEITEKLISVAYGDPLTGVRWSADFPKENYEIELEARRTDGFDFFCALTFPVAETHCSLVLGGWGGGVMGLSNIDGYDASDNETTTFRLFEDEQWYHIRVQVTAESIVCFVDKKQVIEQERKDHEFGIRFEMDPCVPLGIAAYQCDAEYRNVRWRSLEPNSGAEASEK